MDSGQTESTACPFHLFGDLWLEDPAGFLSAIEQSDMSEHMALIQALDRNWKRRPQNNWDLHLAFSKFVELEMATWSKRGIERLSRDLLLPSGSLCSSLACHLLNPTYYVANSEDRLTDDPTSPTIRLLHGSGFSSKNALIFDQICRRGRTEDVLDFYTDEFHQPHRDFVSKLRQNMAAVVEIGWGDIVWGEIEKELGHRLVLFPLWGRFKPVRLYLELDENDRSLKRFIIRARHPQFFVKSGLAKLGTEARKIYGEAQDLALTVARRLVGDGPDSTVNYFQTSLPLRQGNRIMRQQENHCEKNNQLALKAFQTTFPEQYQKRASRVQRLQETKILLQGLRDSVNTMITFKRETVSQDMLVREAKIQFFDTQQLKGKQESLQWARAKRLAEIIASFEKVYNEIVNDDSLEPFNELQPPQHIGSRCTAWEALPRQHFDWIQAQQGLRIRGEPISNREMLEMASQLLHCNWNGTDKSPDFRTSPIIVLAIQTALQYIKEITRTGGELKQTCTIPGSPNKVIERECYTCKIPALDDAFPFSLKQMPETYVVRVYERSDCGRLDCKGENAALTPVDPRQKHTRLRTKALEASVKARKETSTINTLLRSGSDLEGCAKEVLVVLQPKMTCSIYKGVTGYFRAVDAKIPTVTKAALYDILRRFKEVGCNLMDFPKIAEIIFAPKLSYEKRFELLKRAKDPMYVVEFPAKAGRKRRHHFI